MWYHIVYNFLYLIYGFWCLMDVMLMSITAISAIWVLSCLIIPEQRKISKTVTQWQVLWNIEADLEIVKCPRLVFDVNASKCEIKTKASLSPLTKLWNWKLEMASSILLALTLGWLSQAYRAMVVGQGLGNKIILGWMIALDQTIIFGQ